MVGEVSPSGHVPSPGMTAGRSATGAVADREPELGEVAFGVGDEQLSGRRILGAIRKSVDAAPARLLPSRTSKVAAPVTASNFARRR